MGLGQYSKKRFMVVILSSGSVRRQIRPTLPGFSTKSASASTQRVEVLPEPRAPTMAL